MTSFLRLVSGGDSVSIWDGPGYEPVYTYRPAPGQRGVLSNSWNSDGTCIASCIEGSDKVVLTNLRVTSFASVEVSTPLTQAHVRVIYPRTSIKFLVIGSTDKVLFYDVANQKTRKEFKLPNDAKLNSIAANFNDNYFAVGASGGRVFLLNCQTGQVGNPMKSIKLGNVTSVEYSKRRSPVLASSGDSGQVALWDCNANKLTNTFADHNAPATGVAFSPVNEVLLLSSGLDKRCMCYDIQTKRPASVIKTDHPLSSVDFYSDGATLALGTTNGKILIYDLRSFNTPVKVINAHSGPVRSVLFQPHPHSDRSIFGSTGKASTSKMTSQLSKKNLAMTMKENLPSISENSVQNVSSEVSSFGGGGGNFGISTTNFDGDFTDRKESLSSQIFSPIRDTADVFSPAGHNTFGSIGGAANRNSTMSSSRLSYESVISPLRENSMNAARYSPGNSFGQNHLNSRDSVFNSPMLHTNDSGSVDWLKKKSASLSEAIGEPPKLEGSASLSILQMDKPDARQPTETRSSVAGSFKAAAEAATESFSRPTGSSFAGFKLDDGAVGAFANGQDDVDAHVDVAREEVAVVESESKKRRASFDQGGDRSFSYMRAVLTAFPHALDQRDEPASTAPPTQPTAATNQGSREPPVANEVQQFREDYFRGLVEDAMDEFCSDMRRHLWHIQLDQIRALDQHRTEMKNLLSQYAVNESLVMEIERLKEENERLKRSPFVPHFNDE